MFFNECAESANVIEYADFERQVLPSFRMSDTDNALKKLCRERIDAIVSDLKAIDTQPEELKAEILAEFKKSLSATDAITIVADRHKAIKAQMEVQAAREQQQATEAEVVAKVDATVAPAPLAPPVATPEVEADPSFQMTFTVVAPLSKLKALKAYLIEKGIEYK
jgi:hypothetical protein